MAHYKQGAVECITAMESTFGPMDVAVFCRLNAFKYIWRMKVHEDGPEPTGPRLSENRIPGAWAPAQLRLLLQWLPQVICTIGYCRG